MSETNKIVNPFEEKSCYKEYYDKLDALRADGENKIRALNGENRDLKLNKQIDKDICKKLVAKNKEAIKEAQIVKKEKAAEVKDIVKEGVACAKEDGKVFYDEVKKEFKDEYIATIEAIKEEEIQEKQDHSERYARIQQENAEKTEKARAEFEAIKAITPKEASEEEQDKLRSVRKTYENEVKGAKLRIQGERTLHKSRLGEFKLRRENAKAKYKDAIFNAYSEKLNSYSLLENGNLTIGQKIERWGRNYSHDFKFKNWFIKNALYIIILIFFIFTIITGAVQGKQFLSYSNIKNILGQSSVKVFYSLGVAGLILLAGTDLSVGRITGLGASVVHLVLSTTIYSTANGLEIDWFVGMPVALKVVVALLLSILLCTLFTSIAGFFSAKFKMHPFITTLSTQLLMYGISMALFSTVPSFNMESGIKRVLNNGYVNIIIAAAIVIAIVWFIWNKTKFGKNMYAVGGNAEAASVSGISVFWTTFLVFVMAGILYGFGGFATALVGSGANPNTGFGTELDAIAACVIGGVSFSGGIGKISGVVFGTIIFSGLTYCLTFLGYDVNIQYIFKGIIIMAAVCLDSLKYLKKK